MNFQWGKNMKPELQTKSIVFNTIKSYDNKTNILKPIKKQYNLTIFFVLNNLFVILET